MNTLLRVALPLLSALGLTACDETRFASDLAETPGACERDFSGWWRIEEDDAPGSDYVHVGAQCQMKMLTTRRDDGQEVRLALAFHPHVVELGRKTYLTLNDDDFHRLGDSRDEAPDAEARGHAIADAGFHYFRIETRRGRARLYGVDHEEVARRLIDGKLDGDVHKADRQLQNHVQGDTAAMRELARERWLFRGRNPVLLTRVAEADVPEVLRRIAAGAATP